MAKIGIYAGDANDPISNVKASLPQWTRYLSGIGHDVDLFGAALPFDGSDSQCTQLKHTGGGTSAVDKVLYAYRTCVNYCIEYDPDVLIQFWRYPVHAPAVVGAGHRTGVSAVLRYNGDVFRQHRGFSGVTKYLVQAFNTPSKIAPRFADAVVAFGEYGESELVRRGVSQDDIYILPPSGDVGEQFLPPRDKSTVKKRLGLPIDKTLALYVGRIETVKGMDYLRETISQVAAQDQIQFVLVGGGPGRSDHSTHEDVDIFDDDTVRIEGKISHDEIHKYYQAGDVYVHPSPYEGIPLTILEALQCGLPVVARSAGDIHLAVPNIVNGPTEMAQMLLQETWQSGWRNRRPFTKEYQRAALNQIISDVTRS